MLDFALWRAHCPLVHSSNGATQMSRKDFELIAAVVSTIQDRETRTAVATRFANELRVRNPAFQEQRFLRACLGFLPATLTVRS